MKVNKVTEDQNKVLRVVRDVLRGYPQVGFAYLYGSFLQVPEEAEDIDIAVGLKDGEDLYTVLQTTGNIKEDLMERVPLPVDLKALNLATVSFCLDILEEGYLFYETDEEFLAEFIEDISKRAIETITSRYDLEGELCRL